MISGQLAPSSVNFISPQQNYYIEDDITTTDSDGLYKTEKINEAFFSNTRKLSSGSNNFDETKPTTATTTTILSSPTETETTTTPSPITVSNTTTKTKRNPIQTSSATVITTDTAKTQIAGLYNISSNNYTVIATASKTSTTTPSTKFSNNNSSNFSLQLFNQQQQQQQETETTTTTGTTGATGSQLLYNTENNNATTDTSSTNFTYCNATKMAVSAAAATAAAITDARGRSAALERAYVHDVYENCEEPLSGPIRPRVAQFLASLEPGSIVCDVGCGSGRYLTSCNPLVCTIGADRCYRLTKIAREKGGEVALCDNLELPFRDESFDAVLSLAVVHHFATTDRRVGAIRELARILRIGGRVVISVWALEQRHRRFESQDVLIPWQPPKTRNYNLSDDEDDDDYLPPYHAYTEDSTNSSRSAGDGDSSSLSSSSPGESCYSFVRRAIQKLAGGRKHTWFLDSWNSKDTKNDSSLEYEDAKDLPIELRRLEDFEDLPDPPLSAGLKSRSLGSILNPPPRQIVRSRSSVPSLGAQIIEHKHQQQQQQIYPSSHGSESQVTYATGSSTHSSPSKQIQYQQQHSGLCDLDGNVSANIKQTNTSTPLSVSSVCTVSNIAAGGNVSGRRPKLVKQKQSLCDEECQLPDNPIHTIITDNSYVSNYSSNYCNTTKASRNVNSSTESKMFLRKQSSLNEELMAESRLREKERIRKRIQKQMSLNETFLCRSLFTKRLQVIREGFTTKLKTSTDSLERVTKNGFVKIMQNLKSGQFSTTMSTATKVGAKYNSNTSSSTKNATNCNACNETCHNCGGINCNGGYKGTKTNNNIGCKCGNSLTTAATTTNNCSNHSSCNRSCNCNNVCIDGNEDQQKPRRHSRESGSDSSKDSSLQSDTSIESEDSFASVIFIPKSEQKYSNQQQQNGSTNNEGSICNGNHKNSNGNCNNTNSISCKNSGSNNTSSYKIPSVPTSPLIMPCPPTPAHSPAAVTSATSLSTVTTAGYNFIHTYPKLSPTMIPMQGNNNNTSNKDTSKNRFTFDEEHIIQQQKQHHTNKSSILNENQQQQPQLKQQNLPKITRQVIQNLPQIPKFRKQQSLQLTKSSFPIVRRFSAAPAVPKLLSLEIFNPETDDLDSDSSEPSSPDSIDSVISALKPDIDETTTTNHSHHHNQTNLDSSDQSQLDSAHSTETKQSTDITDTSTDHFINVINAKLDEIDAHLILNRDNDDSSKNLIHNATKRSQEQYPQQSFVHFAEELSAQLLKKLEQTNRTESGDNSNHIDVDGIIPDGKNNLNYNSTNSSSRVLNCSDEIEDLCNLKEELRERRLMLANLSTYSQQQQSPASTSSSTSSQTRSLSLYDDAAISGNNELRYSPSLFDSEASKMKFLRNFNDSRQYSYGSVPDTAYLIPTDNYDENSFDDDDDDDDCVIGGDDVADMDEVDHDVIIEEDEDIDEDDYDTLSLGKQQQNQQFYTNKNTINYLDNFEIIKTKDKISSSYENEIYCNDNTNNNNNNNNNYNGNNDKNQNKDNNDNDGNHDNRSNSHDDKDDDGGDDNDIISNDQKRLEAKQSTESWEHSNSTNSLDSPSQGGGSTTHHRYYHVFREGELDALINHHVASLHIVSSYYERASWCVVAEKVQVWTI